MEAEGDGTRTNKEMVESREMEVESNHSDMEETFACANVALDKKTVSCCSSSTTTTDATTNGSSRECPLPSNDCKNTKGYTYLVAEKPRSARCDIAEKQDLQCGSGDKENGRHQERKLSRQDRLGLSRSFQRLVSMHDWEGAESLVRTADVQGLNDLLCVAVDAIWFLEDREELNEVLGLIRGIVSGGANDFARAALRTTFLASCISTCRGGMTSLTDAVNLMRQKLHEHLQECRGDEALKAEASAKVHKFTEWALKCIGLHSRARGNGGRGNQRTIIEVQHQLSAFKKFLDLADNHLTGKDLTEAFNAACFPLTLFSGSFDQGWASGISAAGVQGLLEMLVEGGADNVNQCFLEAARYGNTELVRILLQIAQKNSLDIDVDLALDFAAHYVNIGTMDCLVEEGNTTAFLGPLMQAAERGCLQIVKWFVNRGCREMELCLALTAATSSSQVAVAAYLLPRVPQHVLAALSIEILKAAGERSTGSMDGVDFLLRSDFLSDPSATYAVANSIAKSTDESVDPKLRSFLLEHWSEAAFSDGLRSAEDCFVNLKRIMERGESPIQLSELPLPLVISMAYLPLYRECTEAGLLLPQRLRGQLVEAAGRLKGWSMNRMSQGRELVVILEHHLPQFMVQT